MFGRRNRQARTAQPRRRPLWVRLVRSRFVWFLALLGAIYALTFWLYPGYELIAIIIMASLIITVTISRWAARRRRARTLKGLLRGSPTEFEQAVAALLRRQGFGRIRVTGGAGDLTADITARDPRGQSVVVQCKRYQPGRLIGSEELQTFIGMQRIHHQADRGLYVTTSTYTKPARDLARRHAIVLVDGDEFARLMVSHERARWVDG